MEENTVNTVETTEKAAKADQKTAKKEKKPSFFKGLKTEYKKIVFADKEQTVAVVIMSIFIGALIGVLDMVMKFGLSFIL